LFEKFFHDLAENVGELISPPTGVPAGFMDREMGGGMQWTDELIHAVGTCHNLVALLSPRYLKSEWCGKEWDGFARRAVRKLEGAKASPRQGCIIPVRWVPFPTVLPHPVRTRLVYSPTRDLDPLAPTHYEQNGILGLLQVSRLKKCYEIVTWQLAMHIADIYHSQRTEVRFFDPAELNNAFPE